MPRLSREKGGSLRETKSYVLQSQKPNFFLWQIIKEGDKFNVAETWSMPIAVKKLYFGHI